MTASIYVLSCGSCTSIGTTAGTNELAVRAGINSFRASYLINRHGHNIVVASTNGGASYSASYYDNLYKLQTCALVESVENIYLNEFHNKIHILTNSPILQTKSDSSSENNVAAKLLKKLNLKSVTPQFTNLTNTHAGVLLGFQKLHKLMLNEQIDVCFIVAVESYLKASTLEELDNKNRLHSETNRYGFIPGEGAGFCLLASEEATKRLGIEPLGQIVSVGTAIEKNLINTDSVCTGEGLTDAYRQALSALPEGVKIDQVYTDMNGERYRADEYGFAILRTQEYFKAPENFIAPADCWGDVGAASGALLINLAVTAAQKGYAKGDWSLISTSSDTGERAAAVIYAPNRERDV